VISYLTPLIPLSFKGEGEEWKRGANAPLRHPFSIYLLKGEGEEKKEGLTLLLDACSCTW